MKSTRLIAAMAALVAATALAQQAAEVAAPAAEAPVAAAPAAMPVADSKPATFGDPKAGQAKAAACAACHGMDGNASDPQYPKLAGQHERYIWRQLKLFKSGERDNAIMLGMAAALSEQDMRDIGAYFGSQKVIAGIADESPVASGPNQGRKFYQVGERLYRGGKAEAGVPACMACHGPAGHGNPGPSYPSVGGQHAGYTVTQLTAFRNGTVWGKDANANAIMSAVARNLSDEEIQALATYIQGLHNASAVAKAE
jgi:cytochrome c553